VGLRAETEVIESWCPKKVSSALSVEREWRVRWRPREAESTWADALESGGITTDWC
jgi:hypothetical protein